MGQRVNSILVLGGGSAGFLAAITIKFRLPELPVTVLRSKDIGIIGVGEGTTLTLPQHLHDYMKLDIKEFYRVADPQWKLGIRFVWGKRPFFDYAFSHQLDTKYNLLSRCTGYYCNGDWSYVGIPSGLMSHNRIMVRDQHGRPVVSNDLAYHIENEKFVTWLEGHARHRGVAIDDDTVEEVLQDEHGVTGLRLASGRIATADLYVDCSGFFSVLLGKALNEPFVSFKSSLFNDRAVVGGWTRTDEPIKPYTTAETMNAGWCWQIEHENRINRGYVYSSDFISDEEADAEFRSKNPKVEKTRIVKFRSGRYERAWVKNVVAIGNSSGFVEPLEATSLGAIAGQCQTLAETLAECDQEVHDSLRRQFNRRNATSWDQIRRFLAVHFKFNDRLDTPYWKACRNDAQLQDAEEFVAYYRDMGPSVLWRKTVLDPSDQFGMEGYLSMLVGQQVPYDYKFEPTPQERANWQRIQQAIKNRVTAAFTVREALSMVRSPHWQWPAGLYRQSLTSLSV
jgi:tryptophan halogenase